MKQKQLSDEFSPTIGMIGLGLIGTAISRRLIASGQNIYGFDTDAIAMRRFAETGGLAAESVADISATCDFIFLSLPDGKCVANVIDQCLGCFRPQTIVIDTTTASIEEVLQTHRILSGYAVGYLDATISGSSELVASGQATWMVGGDTNDFHKIHQLLNSIGGLIHHTGPTGSGTQMKLISNLILGLNRAVLAEGLAMAEFWGMDLRRTLEILKTTVAYSRVMDAKGEKMIACDYSPQARLRQHHKDVKLILDSVSDSKMKLYLSALHEELLESAEDQGLGELDNSAIIEIWRKREN
jgi:3-hydroxyisobutyrate dehydrogenase-like beta-hydroxyacid dehydrogenase